MRKAYGIEVLETKPFERNNISIFRTIAFNKAAELACEMMARWGCVAGEADGEDSAGRQKLRVATANELVTRACDIAERAMSEFSARGWVADVPMPGLSDSAKSKLAKPGSE